MSKKIPEYIKYMTAKPVSELHNELLYKLSRAIGKLHHHTNDLEPTIRAYYHGYIRATIQAINRITCKRRTT